MEKTRINKEKIKKKWNRKSKQWKGRENGQKIAENRENTRNLCKICAIYIDISKKFSAINLKIFI